MRAGPRTSTIPEAVGADHRHLADVDRGTLVPLPPKTPDGRAVESISASTLAWSPKGDALMYRGSGWANDLVQFLP